MKLHFSNIELPLNPSLKKRGTLREKEISPSSCKRRGLGIGLIMLIFILFISINLNAQNSSEMVLIPAGKYKPLLRVDAEENVQKFYLDVYPVTNENFLEFVKANPKWSKSNVKKIFADASYLKDWKDDFELGDNVNPDGPVTYVSWFAAKAYAEWKGKRLPTVAEWEYVISSENNIKKISNWYSKISPGKIPSVGSTEKLPLGVYDMYGLIWEWTYDFNSALVTGESRGDGDIERNLFCGSGSSGSRNVEDYPAFMRYGYRSSLKANYTTHNLGFRCAKDYQ